MAGQIRRDAKERSSLVSPPCPIKRQRSCSSATLAACVNRSIKQGDTGARRVEFSRSKCAAPGIASLPCQGPPRRRFDIQRPDPGGLRALFKPVINLGSHRSPPGRDASLSATQLVKNPRVAWDKSSANDQRMRSNGQPLCRRNKRQRVSA